MSDADRQCQLLFEDPAPSTGASTAQINVPEHTLFGRLRREELLGFSCVVRSFVGQGLVLDRARKRMLEDLQEMLFIDSQRAEAELQAAQADLVLQTVAAKRVREHRGHFADALVDDSRGHETDDAPQPSARTRNFPPSKRSSRSQSGSFGRRPKRGRSQSPNEVFEEGPQVAAAQEDPDGELIAMSARINSLQAEIDSLRDQLRDTADGHKKAVIKQKLDTRLADLNKIIEALDDDDEEEDFPPLLPEECIAGAGASGQQSADEDAPPSLSGQGEAHPWWPNSLEDGK
eukprot:NODE_2199_length_1264_cov_24.997531_g2001_i0.p1 GENE.NODE_2199_length_1264_cov_24.997531_g2001_i0~~NODE_2199_length_1264_cov_24.997531_g2001_i0.p1  ORF type:complete len:289 (+),score=62.89 NODE_2199_length_1264_cov_24.997531_g2001_i0:127-993(+)